MPLLAELGIEVSMSRTANCSDNAAMALFFNKLKSECVDRTPFHTQAQARSAIDRRISHALITRCACIRTATVCQFAYLRTSVCTSGEGIGPPQIWVMVKWSSRQNCNESSFPKTRVPGR